jgi:hypothetical protein
MFVACPGANGRSKIHGSLAPAGLRTEERRENYLQMDLYSSRPNQRSSGKQVNQSRSADHAPRQGQ